MALTLQKPRQGKKKQMERKLYTTSPREFNNYIRRFNIPETAEITFWYETPNKTMRTEVKESKKAEKINHPQLQNLFKTLTKNGGLSSEAVEEMNHNSQIFREEFWLDK